MRDRTGAMPSRAGVRTDVRRQLCDLSPCLGSVMGKADFAETASTPRVAQWRPRCYGPLTLVFNRFNTIIRPPGPP